MTDPEFVARLITVAAREAGLRRSVDLLKNDRVLYKAKFRDDVIYLARKHTQLSWTDLAVRLGSRHHTSLIGAFARAEKRLNGAHNPRRDGRTWAEWHEYLLEQVAAEPAEKENQS